MSFAVKKTVLLAFVVALYFSFVSAIGAEAATLLAL
jgi:hypothetical protein